MILEYIKAAIIGIVEGLTEFLPVSSTGHIIIAEQFIHLKQSKAFMDMFNYVIQFGAILAVIVLYFNKLNPFSSKKSNVQKSNTWTLWFKVIVAIIPSMVIGLALNDWMDEHLMTWQVVSAFLIIYGIIFIFVENYNKDKSAKYIDLETMPWKTAFLIGCFQVLSIIPGTSRSGATILGGILLGTSRFVASEFSFFLAIPTMVGVTILKVGKFLIKGNTFNVSEISVLFVGTLVSFVVAIIAIKGFLGFIKTHDFKAFGWYRIVVGIVLIILGMMGVLKGSL